MAAYIPSIRQQNYASAVATTPYSTNVVTAPQVAVASATAAGSLIVVLASGSPAPTGCNDSAGNAYTLYGTSGTLVVFYAFATTPIGAGGWVQVSRSGNFIFCHTLVYELANADPTTPMGVLNTGANTSNTAVATTTTNQFTRANGLRFDVVTYEYLASMTQAESISGASPALTNAHLVGYSTAPVSGTNLRTDGILYADPSGSNTYTVGAVPSNSGTLSPGVNGGSAYFAVIVVNGKPNTVPNAPALTTHPSYDPATSTSFGWTFSDPDVGDTQSAYQLVITRVSDGATIVDTGKVTSATSSATVAGGTLVSGTAYQWKVRAWDNSDAVGPYSTLGSFTALTPPTATITAPAAGGTVTTAIPAITWSYSGTGGQSAYQVRILLAGVQQWTTGKVSSAATSLASGIVLTNGVAYTAEVTVWDSLDIQGTPATSAFTASFTSPVTPTLSGTADADGGAIRLNVNTRGPNSAQAATTTFDILRKRTTDSAYTRIKAGLAAAPSRNATLSATVITDAVPSTIRRTVAPTANWPDLFAADSSLGVYPAATNLLLRSNKLNTSPWVLSGLTVTESTGTDEYGNATLNRITRSNNSDGMYQPVTVAASTQYTVSWYAKRGTATAALYSLYDLSNGAYIASTVNYDSVLNSSTLTRVVVTFTTPAGCTSLIFVPLDAGGGTGTIFLSRFQLETGSFATPYIDTAGTTATRAAGRASVPSSVVTAQQGWLAFRFRAGFPSTTSYVPMLGSWNDGTYDNRIDVEFGTPSFLINRTGGGVAGNAYTAAQSFAAGSDHTVCVAYTATVITIEIDGAAFVTPVAQSAIPTGLPATLEVGSQTNHSAGNEAASAFYWVAFGTGTLTDANAAALHAYGNAAPTADQINAAMPAAVCTGVLRGSDGTIDTTVASYVDYCPRSGTPYQYEARAIAASTGGTADSAPATLTATITEGVFLHRASDAANTIHHFLYDRGSRGDADQNGATFLQFAGRSYPVAQVPAVGASGSVSVDLELPMALGAPHGCSDLDALRAIYDARDTVCYRDHRGRKVFGFIPSLNKQDELLRYTTQLAVTRTDYSESV